MKKNNVIIILPVYNDWQSLENTLLGIYNYFRDTNLDLEILLVNDCSNENINQTITNINLKLTIINLVKNIGSQKAISLGLKYVYENYKNYNFVVVMDADGEDKPEDIAKLIDRSTQSKKIVFAKRSSREEKIIFKIFYYIYKFVFKFLTGKVIDFGNFSCIPSNFLPQVISLSDLNLHYAASIIKSKILFDKIECNKGKRSHGISKVSFNRHVLHGLISLSIFIEQISISAFIFSFFSMVVSIILSFIIFLSKIFYNNATVGWSSVVLLSLFILFIIFFLISIFSLSILLNKNNYTLVNSVKVDQNLIQSVNKFRY